MSHGFTTVQWNRNKKVYDGLLWVGIVLAIALNIAFSASTPPVPQAPSMEILVLRALGDTGFLLLTLILSVGPLARLNERFLPLLYNRRHMGVSFFFVVLAHGLFALVWYHGFGLIDPLTSLFTGQGKVETFSEYRFQPLGFFALVIFFLMAATSHDYWNAVLGPGTWKALHMLVYVAYGLVLLHMSLGALQSDHSALPDWAPIASLVLVGSLHLASLVWVKQQPTQLAHADWIEIEDPGKIAPNGARVIEVANDERIAIFRNPNNEFGAISNVCRHQAGPLGEGCMVDGLVTCPWHGFQYQLIDGASPPPFEEKVATYEMKLEDGTLLLNPNALPAGTKRPLVKLIISEDFSREA